MELALLSTRFDQRISIGACDDFSSMAGEGGLSIEDGATSGLERFERRTLVGAGDLLFFEAFQHSTSSVSARIREGWDTLLLLL